MLQQYELRSLENCCNNVNIGYCIKFFQNILGSYYRNSDIVFRCFFVAFVITLAVRREVKKAFLNSL